MSAGKAIFGRLSTVSDVNDSVGGRISPLREEQGDALPRITYDVSGTSRDKAYDGNTGLVQRSVDVAVEAASYAEAELIAEKVRAAIDDGKGTWGGIVVLGAFFEDDDEDEDTDAETNVTTYTKEQTFTVWTRE